MTGRSGRSARRLARGLLFTFGALLHLPSQAVAQQPATRVAIDSVAITGAVRVERASILTTAGIVAGDTIDIRDLQEAEKRLWNSGEFSDIRILARGSGAEEDPVILELRVEEAPYINRVDVRGLERISSQVVADSAGLVRDRPYTPDRLLRSERAIRNGLAGAGVPFARITSSVEPVPDGTNRVDILIEVEEGARIAIAEYRIEGNEELSDAEIIGALSAKPEGFWWFRTGTLDERTLEEDLTGRLPDLYRSRGYLDMEILDDTVVVDPNTGKARIEILLEEGPRYRVAQLSIEGNREFDDEQLERFFLPRTGGILESLGIGRDDEELEQGRVFDAVAFEQSGDQIRSLYANEGFIFADVDPTLQKGPPLEEGGDPTVLLEVRIREGTPAFINQVSIAGNEYTYDRVIRDRITVLPGDVYSQDRIIQSMQAIEGLGFFEPMTTAPDVQVNQETGEVDVTFFVEEKQTGTVNFGSSLGGGRGLSGFIGYEQPNLFGQAKSGQVRWDFGRFVNNFTVTFTDPALFQSRTSGTITLFNSRDRFFQFSSGRRNRVGGSLRFGFPFPGALRTRFFVGYGLSRTDFDLFDSSDDASLFGRPPGTLSQVTLGVTRSTLNNPVFPSTGTRYSWNMAINGGVFGGDGDFTKHSVETELWVPVWSFGGQNGGAPARIALGTKLRGGSIFGDVSDFPFERFWMGGVQFGETLRGYDETSITPLGFFPERSNQVRDIDRLGNTFMGFTSELALRASSQFSLRAFFDAGNTWFSFDEVNPTQLFRGAGFGTTVVTPFGPIGIDYAYGFDKPEPGWQFHFTLGQGF